MSDRSYVYRKGFFVKNFRLGKWAHFGFKKWHIVLTLGLIKRLFGANGPFSVKKMAHPHNSGLARKVFEYVWHNEWG